MEKLSWLYSVLDLSASVDSIERELDLADCYGITNESQTMIKDGLKYYLSDHSSGEKVDMALLKQLMKDRLDDNPMLATLVGIGYSMHLMLHFQYSKALELLLIVKSNSGCFKDRNLELLVNGFVDFLDIKLSHQLATEKLVRTATHFESLSYQLRESGQVKLSLYIGLIGIVLCFRIDPTIDTQPVKASILQMCVYYGYNDLLEFYEVVQKADGDRVCTKALKENGAVDEWTYRLMSEAGHAFSISDFQTAANLYKQLAEHFLFSL